MGSTFRICYGIKSYNSNGSERPYDVMVSEEFRSLADAQANLRRYLDQMADGMAIHHVNRRKHEVAFAWIREYPENCEGPDEWNETDFAEIAGDQIISEGII